MAEKPIPGKDRLTVQQNEFAHALVKTGSVTEAGRAAYPNASRTSQPVLAGRAHGNPKVQRKVDQLLAEKYPEHESDFAQVIQIQLRRIREGLMRDSDANEFIKLFAKIKGYEAPSQHQTLRANLKLPSED